MNGEIQKVSFYKQSSTCPKTLSASGQINLMMISLPRLRCLELNGEPYKPAWAVEAPKVLPVISVPVSSAHGQKMRHATTRQKNGFTQFEQEVYELHSRGMDRKEIAEATHKTVSHVTSALARYISKKQTNG